MKYLSPQIANILKNNFKIQTQKSLAKKGISCGIFQDLGEVNNRYDNKIYIKM